MLAAARNGGLEPAELQIDFDCAEGKLAGYRRWLAALRPAASRTPLVHGVAGVLDRDDFVALAGAPDGRCSA